MTSGTTTCRDIERLLPEYALGLLDAPERRRVEGHLGTCRACRQQLSGYQRTADGLLFAVEPVAPPARLRSRLQARIAARRPRPSPWAVRPPWLTWSRAAGLALVAVLVGLNAYSLFTAIQIRREQRALVEQTAFDRTALALLTYPTSEVTLVSGDPGYGTLVYDPGFQIAVLYAWKLEPLPVGQAYQAWLIRPDGSRVSGGLFQSSDGEAFTRVILRAPGPLSEFVGSGVPVEPEQGRAQPTGPRVLSADL